jgi:hypothetical protein
LRRGGQSRCGAGGCELLAGEEVASSALGRERSRRAEGKVLAGEVEARGIRCCGDGDDAFYSASVPPLGTDRGVASGGDTLPVGKSRRGCFCKIGSYKRDDIDGLYKP